MIREIGSIVTWLCFSAAAVYALFAQLHTVVRESDFALGVSVGVLGYLLFKSAVVCLEKGHDALYSDPASEWPLARIFVLLLGFQGFFSLGTTYL